MSASFTTRSELDVGLGSTNRDAKDSQGNNLRVMTRAQFAHNKY